MIDLRLTSTTITSRSTFRFLTYYGTGTTLIDTYVGLAATCVNAPSSASVHRRIRLLLRACE
jgi:hypothetical protein